jgi:hypothetical protein
MSKLSRTIATAWENLNPSEPSPAFLAKFMAVAVALFAAAYVISLAVNG